VIQKFIKAIGRKLVTAPLTYSQNKQFEEIENKEATLKNIVNIQI